MIERFIASETFTHQIDCFCPDRKHTDVLTIHKMDVIEITNDRKHHFDRGWYFLVVLNNQGYLYMALEDIERYFLQGRLATLLDLELKVNFLQSQIDRALDIGDKELFLNTTTELEESGDLKVTLDNYLMTTAVNYITH